MNKKQSERKERTGSLAKGGKTRALLIERKQMTHSIFSLSFYLCYPSIFGHLKESWSQVTQNYKRWSYGVQNQNVMLRVRGIRMAKR